MPKLGPPARDGGKKAGGKQGSNVWKSPRKWLPMLGKSGETGFQGLEKPARSPRKARRGGRVLATKATKRTKKRKKEAEGAREGTLTRRSGGKRDNGPRLAGDGLPHPTPQLPNHQTRNGQTNRKRAGGGGNGKRGKNGWARKRKICLKMGLARDRVGASCTSGKLGGRDNNTVICNRKSFVRKKSSKFFRTKVARAPRGAPLFRFPVRLC